MPRCGQASRMAKARPCWSRPTTRGCSSSIVGNNSPRFTLSLGKARYQKPKSIRESGVCDCSGESSGMEQVRIAHKGKVSKFQGFRSEEHTSELQSLRHL